MDSPSLEFFQPRLNGLVEETFSPISFKFQYRICSKVKDLYLKVDNNWSKYPSQPKLHTFVKKGKISTEMELFEKFEQIQIQIQIWISILIENESWNVKNLLDFMSIQIKILLLNFGGHLSGNTSFQVLSSRRVCNHALE